jgi:hypothetical protein
VSAVRVYVPATFTALGRLAERRTLGSAPLFACAVTPDLREWYPGGGEAELDHVALTAAAMESLRLLAADDQETRRRVVLAVDVDSGSVTSDPAAGRTSVRVDADVLIADVVALHVDGEDAIDEITAAAHVFDTADRGDPDAAMIVRSLEDLELLWYGTQEIDDLLRR